MKRLTLCVALMLWAAPALASHAPVEGFGAASQGGTGQPECIVTTLANAGTGSLRECLAGGHRLVKFSVTGTIQLASALAIESFTTIDGFSAPAPGITIAGHSTRIWDAQHVVIQNIRIHNVGFTGTTLPATDPPSTTWGTVTNEIDCVDVQGTTQHLVFDHVSVHNCGDGGIDIKAPAKDVSIQWSIVSTWKQHLWGSTSSGESPITGRISYHHNALICNDQGTTTDRGCDRNPLIRAAGATMLVDFRRNIVQGAIRANATKIESNAFVNVVGNAYIPQPATTVAQRQQSIQVAGQVYTAGNVEYPSAAQGAAVNLNVQGNLGSPHAVPAITEYEIGCAKERAGAWPRDTVDLNLLTYAAAVPSVCTAAAVNGEGGGGGGGGGGGTTTGTMVVNPVNPSVGGTYQVSITGGPGHRADWVGVKPVGAPVASYIEAPESWNYASDTKLYPAAGTTAFTVTLTLPPACSQPCEVFFAGADSFNMVPGFAPVQIVGTVVPPGTSTTTALVQQVRLTFTKHPTRPAVQSHSWRANGTQFATTANATWSRPAGNTAPVPAFTVVVTYVDGTTETLSPVVQP